MNNHPLVSVVMGSQSDWAILTYTAETLSALGIAHETEIVSAHRTPDKLFQYAEEAEARGIEIIIAGAGGAAHLPGMLAAKTWLPIFGVPMPTQALEGLDSLLSIMQMPKGIPVGTLAIGKPGAINAALLAAACLANKYPEIKVALQAFRKRQTQDVLDNPDPKKGKS
jgi:5-(carboxyamino)imidazole ribonucleotide mutase